MTSRPHRSLRTQPGPWLQQYPQLMRQARRLSRGDEHGAEDLVQDVYARAMEATPEGVESPRRWSRVVLHNLARSRWSRAYRRMEMGEDAPDPCADQLAPDDELCTRQRDAHLLVLLERLPEKYRRPVELRYLEGHSLHEVSELLGIPYRTVRTQQRRGLERLRQLMLSDPVGD